MKNLFFMEYLVACYEGSALKQNMHPKGAKFRNTPQLRATDSIRLISFELEILTKLIMLLQNKGIVLSNGLRYGRGGLSRLLDNYGIRNMVIEKRKSILFR